MGKIERWGMVLAVLLFGAIMVLTFTDSLFPSRERTVHKVSVVVDDADLSYWENFKSGAEKAAVELNVDISFNTLSEKGNVVEQRQVLEREVESGAEALVVSPADTSLMQPFLEEISGDIPLVTVGSRVSDTITHIGVNNYEAGRNLGNMLKDRYGGQEIYVAVFSHTGIRLDQEDFYMGMQAVLEPEGISSGYVHQDAGTYMKSYISSRGTAGSVNIAVCLDLHSLETAAAVFEEADDVRLYGTGYNDSTLYGLENELIDGLVVHDTYVEGFLSIMNAVRILDKEWTEDEAELMPVILFPDDIYKEEYQQLLFPVS